MKKHFVKWLQSLAVLTALFLVAPAMAEVSTSGLSDAQKAQLEVQAAQMKMENSSPKAQIATVENVSQWVNVGSNIGKGLVGAAKELGVTANEFAVTPLGKVATGLIVWKILGTDLTRIVAALLICFGFIPFIYSVMNKLLIQDIKYSYEDGGIKYLVFLGKVRRVDSVRYIDGDAFVIIRIVGIGAMIGAAGLAVKLFLI